MKYQVDVNEVRKIQNNIWDQIKGTFNFRKGFGEPVPVFGHYGGIFKCGNDRLVIHTDGVGTKLIVAREMKKYDTVGIDAVAMSVNDILCVGAAPLVGVDYIALEKEDSYLVSELMKGLVTGAKESNMAIIGGETAIVPDLLKENAYDLTVTVVGKVQKLVLGNEIKNNDVIVGLESSGLHSNGYTLARKILDIKDWGEEMLKPTRIYVNPVLEMIDACDVHGIAHITGGAYTKLSRLNKEVGFSLDLPEPEGIFKELSKKVKENDLVRTFNMGVGMAIILPEDRADTVINIANKHDVEAFLIGKITDKKGVWYKEKNISYEG